MRGRPGRRASAAGLALVALLAAGCASHRGSAAAAGPRATVIETFRPYAADGTLAVRVADVSTGSCWTTSIAAPVPGAYRCIATDAIYDPCFAPSHPTSPVEVACVADPWSQAHVLRVTGPLPGADSAPPPRVSRPWALELANGDHCVAATGTVPQVAGVNLDYQCTRGRDAGLVGTAAATEWVEYGAPNGATLRRVAVTTAWRG